MALRRSIAWLVVLAAALALPAALGRAADRIIGGELAPPGSWPAIVALIPSSDPGYLNAYCAGTLIDPRWVLTAAHCVNPSQLNDPSEIDVGLGLTDLTTADKSGRRDVAAIVRHPGFTSDNANNPIRDDVALLRLATPAVLSPTVATMDLVSPLRPDLWDDGSPVEVAGWGNTAIPPATPAYPVQLRQVGVTIVGDQTCAGLLAGAPIAFSPGSMLCAGELAGGRDACDGDSGGPLTALDGSTRMLVGAVSWGVGCAQPNAPGVYTRLDALRAFIFGPSGLNVTAPTAPATGVTAVAGIRSAVVAWTPPAANGGRAISAYAIRVLHDGVAERLVPVSGSENQATITGLVEGQRYTFTVLAANAAGVGPESAPTAPAVPVPPAPANLLPPRVSGTARAGRPLRGSAGEWSDLGQLSLHWQACAPGLQTCADLPGAATARFVPRAAQVGRRLRLVVIGANAGGRAIAVSDATGAVLPVYAVRVTRILRAHQTRGGLITLRAGIVVEPESVLRITVVDRRGRPRPLSARISRVNGRRARRNGPNGLVAKAGASGRVALAVSLAGSRRGAVQPGRLRIVAAHQGERASRALAFRARL